MKATEEKREATPLNAPVKRVASPTPLEGPTRKKVTRALTHAQEKLAAQLEHAVQETPNLSRMHPDDMALLSSTLLNGILNAQNSTVITATASKVIASITPSVHASIDNKLPQAIQAELQHPERADQYAAALGVSDLVADAWTEIKEDRIEKEMDTRWTTFLADKEQLHPPPSNVVDPAIARKVALDSFKSEWPPLQKKLIAAAQKTAIAEVQRLSQENEALRKELKAALALLPNSQPTSSSLLDVVMSGALPVPSPMTTAATTTQPTHQVQPQPVPATVVQAAQQVQQAQQPSAQPQAPVNYPPQQMAQPQQQMVQTAASQPAPQAGPPLSIHIPATTQQTSYTTPNYQQPVYQTQPYNQQGGSDYQQHQQIETIVSPGAAAAMNEQHEDFNDFYNRFPGRDTEALIEKACAFLRETTGCDYRPKDMNKIVYWPLGGGTQTVMNRPETIRALVQSQNHTPNTGRYKGITFGQPGCPNYPYDQPGYTAQNQNSSSYNNSSYNYYQQNNNYRGGYRGRGGRGRGTA